MKFSNVSGVYVPNISGVKLQCQFYLFDAGKVMGLITFFNTTRYCQLEITNQKIAVFSRLGEFSYQKCCKSLLQNKSVTYKSNSILNVPVETSTQTTMYRVPTHIFFPNMFQCGTN